MAELNFGILDTQAPGRIAAMPQQREEQQAKNAMQFMQVQQAMGQNELAKYQLSSARRTDEETNKLRALYGEASDISDPNFIRKVYAINPEKGIALDKAIAERAGKKLTQTKTEGEIQAQKYKFFVDRLSSLSQDPSDAGIDRFLKEAVDGGVMSFELASAKSAQLKGMSLPERQKAILGAGQSAKDALAALKPKFEEFSGGLYNVNEVDPNTGMPRFLSQRFAPLSTDAAIRSANAAGMKWNPETLQFENVGGALAQPGFAPAQGTPAAAPAPAGAPRTPPTFPSITPQVQTQRNNEQIALLNAELSQPVNSNPADQQRIRAEIAKLSTGNPFAAAGANPLPVVNNMPGAAAAAAAPVVNAMNVPSPREIREARAKGYAFNPDGTMSPIRGGPADPTVQAAQTTQKLSAKDLQKREAVYPQATAAIKGFETKADSFIKDLVALRDDVGLNQITGSIYGRTGSVSREGSRAQALYDKIVAKGGFQALQDLRDASKTGGALGNVSNQEGKQLTASFAAIDRRQNASDVQAAINQAIADIEGARIRTREAYDSTYAYKTPADSTAPSTAPVDMPSAAAAEIARRAAAAKR